MAAYDITNDQDRALIAQRYPDSNEGGPHCGTCFGGWHCTRPPGHEGPHVAYGLAGPAPWAMSTPPSKEYAKRLRVLLRQPGAPAPSRVIPVDTEDDAQRIARHYHEQAQAMHWTLHVEIEHDDGSITRL